MMSRRSNIRHFAAHAAVDAAPRVLFFDIMRIILMPFHGAPLLLECARYAAAAAVADLRRRLI